MLIAKVRCSQQSATQHQPNKLIVDHVGFRASTQPTRSAIALQKSTIVRLTAGDGQG